MKIIRKINQLKANISNIKKLGFVPTMGGLHKGHISLVKKSKQKCNKTLVSIYINPTQFNKKKDYSKYPRNIKKDIRILKKLNVDLVFIPKTSEIYKKKRKKNLTLHTKKNILCGKHRKGHFEGVIDIIDRLLNMINPTHIFLGEKDFQQLFLIKKYVQNKFNVKIVPCKTIRDKNFAPLSSRNLLLSQKNIKTAGNISKTLIYIKKILKLNKNNNKKLNFFKNNIVKKYNVKIDYLEARNENDLSTFKVKKKFRIFIAYYLNKVRLIDNY